jgi:hypothetical protein
MALYIVTPVPSGTTEIRLLRKAEPSISFTSLTPRLFLHEVGSFSGYLDDPFIAPARWTTTLDESRRMPSLLIVCETCDVVCFDLRIGILRRIVDAKRIRERQSWELRAVGVMGHSVSRRDSLGGPICHTNRQRFPEKYEKGQSARAFTG